MSIHPGDTGPRLDGCTCPPEQIGPDYRADKNCPLHGLEQVLGGLDTTGWVTLKDGGLEASGPTREAAQAMLDRLRGAPRRR